MSHNTQYYLIRLGYGNQNKAIKLGSHNIIGKGEKNSKIYRKINSTFLIDYRKRR
jgi:hypothetical protein